MRKTPFLSKPESWLFILALIGALAAATSARRPGSTGEESWRIQDEDNTVQVVRSAERGVVLVTTARSRRTGASAPEVSRRGNGSGFFIDGEGHIVTNNHVIEGSTSIEVQTHSGKIFKATVVGADRFTDLAVLKVEAPKEEAFPLPLADYRQVQVGQKAIVLGCPLATGSDMGLDGPLLDSKGEVVGVVTAIMDSANGIGFAGFGSLE